MYINSLVIFTMLIYFPNHLLGLNEKCNKFYVPVTTYYENDWNHTVLDPSSVKIDWNRYTIKTNSSELKDINRQCVLYLKCDKKDEKCRPIVNGTVSNSIHETIPSDTTIKHYNNITTDDKDEFSDKEISSDYINGSSSMKIGEKPSEIDKNNNKTISKNDTRIDKEIDDISKEIVETKSPDNNTLDGIEAVTTSEEITTESPELDITTSENDVTTDDGYIITVSPSVDTNTEDVEVLKNINNTGNITAKVVLDNKSGNTSKHTSEATGDKTIGGIIAIGILVAVISVALFFLAKHFILGYLQSGVYNVPEA